jgi:hypothetical protein
MKNLRSEMVGWDWKLKKKRLEIRPGLMDIGAYWRLGYSIPGASPLGFHRFGRISSGHVFIISIDWGKGGGKPSRNNWKA